MPLMNQPLFSSSVGHPVLDIDWPDALSIKASANNISRRLSSHSGVPVKFTQTVFVKARQPFFSVPLKHLTVQ